MLQICCVKIRFLNAIQKIYLTPLNFGPLNFGPIEFWTL